MDGGRCLRALLATRLEYSHATLVAARVGQFMAFVFGFVGLFTDPFLVFIALFVWLGAEQESATVQMHNSLGAIPVQQAMLTHFQTLQPDDPLVQGRRARPGRLAAGFPCGLRRSGAGDADARAI